MDLNVRELVALELEQTAVIMVSALKLHNSVTVSEVGKVMDVK